MTDKKAQPPGFSIREATDADLPVLVDFLAKLALHVVGCAPKTLKEDEQQRLREVLQSALGDENKQLLVAETPEFGLVGMGYVYVWRSQGIWEQTEPVEYRSGVIDDVWVEPEFRSRGVFRALLKQLVAFAESHHAYELILEYTATNKQARAVWTKMGFVTTGVRASAPTSTVKAALAE
ncbi:GNAT family N-acetyltransferase [Microbulbifer yueqingensis]|uniref:Ribosomal protein S18 acetylase RimI n=1 Tax=Microbulbifer yueqingensis TaxID=658219 RepID=A0A1G8V7M8_9GAMM|nr:GNAT family N-acetyltransferase [Microbulbifer yueqingensis]SDJ62088.1 Ribosomal protein S18 acetylase RimI [Microbulbifer yueqingensis]